jgi:putative N6-adenine-specific DNA methylase
MDAWKARLKKLGRRPLSGDANERRALVLIRFNDDVCTISLDTSGEILHKRGMRELVAEAPLRETTAAALLLMLEKLAPSQGAAPSEVELVDPMMGGGTFLIEARSLRDRVTSRSFAFEAMEPLMAKKGETPKLTCARPPAYGRLVGYEADEKTYRAACENIKASDFSDGPGENGFRRQLHCQDFFYAAPLVSGPERWLIANPPYGERLKIEGRLVDFYSDLFAQAERVAQPTRACFLLPAKASPTRLKLPSTWKRAGEQPFLNGGIAVIAHFFLSLRP